MKTRYCQQLLIWRIQTGLKVIIAEQPSQPVYWKIRNLSMRMRVWTESPHFRRKIVTLRRRWRLLIFEHSCCCIVGYILADVEGAWRIGKAGLRINLEKIELLHHLWTNGKMEHRWRCEIELEISGVEQRTAGRNSSAFFFLIGTSELNAESAKKRMSTEENISLFNACIFEHT